MSLKVRRHAKARARRARGKRYTGASARLVLKLPDGREYVCKPFTIADLNYTPPQNVYEMKERP